MKAKITQPVHNEKDAPPLISLDMKNPQNSKKLLKAHFGNGYFVM